MSNLYTIIITLFVITFPIILDKIFKFEKMQYGIICSIIGYLVPIIQLMHKNL